MSLSGLSAALSTDGLPAILLQKSGVTLETLPIVHATDEHRSFIIGTWVRSYEAHARRQGYRQFYAKHEPTFAELWWSKCKVVTDDGYTVHAWVCGNGGVLRHCYVVPELRRIRIATRLIEHACGELKEYARHWPYYAHAPVNPYRMGALPPEREKDG